MRRLLSLNLAADFGVFRLDHTLGQFEIVVIGQFLKQALLGFQPAGVGKLLADLLADRLAQRGQVFEAEVLGEFVIDLNRHRLADLGHLALERRQLAGVIGARVIVRERHLDGHRLASFGADQLILETRDEGVRAKLQLLAFGATALERLAVDVAGEIKDQDIALFGFALAFDRFAALLLAGHPFQRVVDVLIARLGFGTHQGQGRKIHRCDLRHQLHRQIVLQVLTFVELGDFNLRLGCRTIAALVERLLAGFVDRLFQNLAQQRAAIALFQQRRRHFARPKPGQVQRRRNFSQSIIHFGIDFTGFHDNFKRALQTFVECLGNLH